MLRKQGDSSVSFLARQIKKCQLLPLILWWRFAEGTQRTSSQGVRAWSEQHPMRPRENKNKNNTIQLFLRVDIAAHAQD